VLQAQHLIGWVAGAHGGMHGIDLLLEKRCAAKPGFSGRRRAPAADRDRLRPAGPAKFTHLFLGCAFGSGHQPRPRRHSPDRPPAGAAASVGIDKLPIRKDHVAEDHHQACQQARGALSWMVLLDHLHRSYGVPVMAIGGRSPAESFSKRRPNAPASFCRRRTTGCAGPG